MLDQQSIGKDKSSLVQVIKTRPREAGNNICTQAEGMHQDTDISLEEECIEPISAHEMWEIDDWTPFPRLTWQRHQSWTYNHPLYVVFQFLISHIHWFFSWHKHYLWSLFVSDPSLDRQIDLILWDILRSKSIEYLADDVVESTQLWEALTIHCDGLVIIDRLPVTSIVTSDGRNNKTMGQ